MSVILNMLTATSVGCSSSPAHQAQTTVLYENISKPFIFEMYMKLINKCILLIVLSDPVWREKGKKCMNKTTAINQFFPLVKAKYASRFF